MITLYGGRSEKDRISFCTKNNYVTAVSKNGKIHYILENSESKSNGKITLKDFKKSIWIIVLFALPLIIKEFILIPLIKTMKISSIWYLIPTFLYSIVTVYLIIDIRKEQGRRFLRNHAAEHMVYLAYKKLKRIPTLKEVRKFSRISKKCGATKITCFIMGQIIGFIVYVCTGYAIPELLLVICSFVFCTDFPFYLISMLVQLFTTSKPQKQNLKLALSALYALKLVEQYGEKEISDLNSGIVKIKIE